LCNGNARGGHVCRPLSGSTARKIHYIIRGALEPAVRWRHLGVNRAAMAVAPFPNPTEPDPPSAAEAAAILNEAWTDPDRGLLLWLTMITGPRRGELSALRWRHVDFERALVWVRRSNAHTKAGIKEKETKTRQRRKISLDPHTLSLLAVHRERWERRCADLGCELGDDAFLFSPAPDGSTPYVPRSITQRYRRMATKLKRTSTRLHYSATELIAAEVDIRTVAGRLGTAVAAPQPSRCTPPGSTTPTAGPRARWPTSGLCPLSSNANWSRRSSSTTHRFVEEARERALPATDRPDVRHERFACLRD
jgi:integrase